MMINSEDCGGGEVKVKSTGRESAVSGTEVLADFTYVRKVTEKCDECPKALFSSISIMLNPVSFCLSVVIEDMTDDEVISADMLRAVGTFEGPELSAEDDEG